jgi:Fe-S-cluster containining protein
MGDPSVTANIKMTIAGYELEAHMTVPTRPVSLRFMLPLVHSLANGVVDVAVQASEAQGKSISCKKGCGACCRQLVPIAEVEARGLRALVDDLPEPRRTEIRARFADARRRLEAVGVWQKLQERDQLGEGEFQKLGLEYFSQGVACPFLEEESCSIHPDRPVSCREYLVTSPAAECSKPSPETVKLVPMPKKVWTALARFDATPPGMKYLRWVPLIMALAWAQENPDEPAERPGPEWLSELFNRFTDKKG